MTRHVGSELTTVGNPILTSNKGFFEGGELLANVVIAPAVLGRLLHHSHVLNTRGESYRLKDKRQAGLLTSTPLTTGGTGTHGRQQK